MAHDDEKMADRRLAQTRNMERRRMRIAALYNHAMARAHVVVTRGTVDVVALAPARQQLVRKWHRQIGHLYALGSAGVQGFLKVQLAARHSSRHQIAG